jgi:hypothetical protein
MSFYSLPNIGIYLDTFDPFIFQRIKQETNKFLTDFSTELDESKDLLRLYHKKQQGYSTNYKLSDELVLLIDKEVLKLLSIYENKYQYFDRLFNFVANAENKEIKLSLERVWVNLQRRGEFLPLHNHSGIYSFVIWTTIPYAMADEKDNIANPDLIKNRTANFEFVYVDALGKINNYPIPVDKTLEGKICIFPSELQHQVYPFYSTDDVRISLAGNYRLEIE